MTNSNENERNFIEVKDMNKMWELKEIVGIKDNHCYYCKKELKKGGKCSVFNKPDRLICDSLLCLSEAVGEKQSYSNEKRDENDMTEEERKSLDEALKQPCNIPFDLDDIPYWTETEKRLKHESYCSARGASAYEQFLADKQQHEKEMKDWEGMHEQFAAIGKIREKEIEISDLNNENKEWRRKYINDANPDNREWREKLETIKQKTEELENLPIVFDSTCRFCVCNKGILRGFVEKLKGCLNDR